jgi:transaldolase
MKILLASVDLDQVRWASSNCLADGVWTTPALLASAEGEQREVIADICRVAGMPVWATVTHIGAQDIYRDGKELAKISDLVAVQVPFVEDAIGAMRRLSADGVRVGATLVFNAAQALLAAKAGASTVTTAIDQLAAVGEHTTEVVREIRRVFDVNDVECDVMAALPGNAAQFADCAVAGADSVSLTPAVLRSLLVHPLTDRGVDQFLNELARHARGRVPT